MKKYWIIIIPYYIAILNIPIDVFQKEFINSIKVQFLLYNSITSILDKDLYIYKIIIIIES